MIRTAGQITYDQRDIVVANGQHQAMKKPFGAVMNRFTFLYAVFRNDDHFSRKQSAIGMTRKITQPEFRRWTLRSNFRIGPNRSTYCDRFMPFKYSMT